MNAVGSTSMQFKFMLYCVTTKMNAIVFTSVNVLKIVCCLFRRVKSMSHSYLPDFSSIHLGR